MAAVIQAALLGVVQGVTEFLPVSSTAHLLIASRLLGFQDPGGVFTVMIQLGSIFAVVWLYRAKILDVVMGLPSRPEARRFAAMVLVALVPALVAGGLLSGFVTRVLYNALAVTGVTFVLGGIVILLVESRKNENVRVETAAAMTWLDALKVGIAQCFALIPGTSRSGATIIGGMLFGLSRKAATEFSFFLAVPTLVAAGLYDLWKHRSLLSAADAPIFGVGMAVSFVCAFVVIRWLIRYVATHDFKPFAWYRIAFGLVVLVTAYLGWVDWKD